MKTIKPTLLAIMLLFIGTINQSQAQISLGLNLGVGIPTGDMADVSKGGLSTGFGGELQGRYHVNDNFAFGLNIGYYNWGISATVPTGLTFKFTTLPVMGVVDFYLKRDGFRPFTGVELGYCNWTATVSGSIASLPVDISNTGSGIAFAPFFGGAYPISDNLDLFGKLKYFFAVTENSSNGASNLSYFALNVGASLKF